MSIVGGKEKINNVKRERERVSQKHFKGDECTFVYMNEFKLWLRCTAKII